MRFLLITVLMSLSMAAEARIQVLFHPHDPTLEKIAQYFSEAKSTIDIAMYNMDVVPTSPVIQILQSPDMQKRLKSGDLKVRMVLELYGTPEDNQIKRQTMEDLGVDVRYYENAQKVSVHHKFAIIDANGDLDRVITGSANWSVWSEQNYNENILYFDQEHEVTARYQVEFNRLWTASTEFGKAFGYPDNAVPSAADEDGIEVYFNSPKILAPNSTESTSIQNQLVRLINGAQHSLQIATTRIRIVPVLEAVLAAAQRGVVVQIVISEDDFSGLSYRAKYLLNNPNVQLRIKFYNLKLSDYLAYQMHNKFMIVDGETVQAGSFNWSDSSENNYLENIVVLSKAAAQEVLPAYQTEFAAIWDMGRNEYAPTLEALKQGQHPACEIPQMVLTRAEISALLDNSPNCK